MCLYLSLLARVMFTAPPQARALLHIPEITDGSPPQVQARMLQLVDLWLKRFDNVGAVSSGGPWRRKVVALSLVSLLDADPAVLERLDLILNVAVDVIAELRTTTASSVVAETVSDGLVLGTSDLYTSNLRSMFQDDMVQHTELSSFLQKKLGDAEAVVGASAFQNVISGIDPVIFQQLQEK
jgi:hypothetical protein